MSGDVKRYQVIAPMVVAKSSTPQGVKLQNFYRHAHLPQDVPQAMIERFLRRRLIVEIDADGQPVKAGAAPAAAAPAKPVRGAAAKTAG